MIVVPSTTHSSKYVCFLHHNHLARLRILDIHTFNFSPLPTSFHYSFHPAIYIARCDDLLKVKTLGEDDQAVALTSDALYFRAYILLFSCHVACGKIRTKEKHVASKH